MDNLEKEILNFSDELYSNLTDTVFATIKTSEIAINEKMDCVLITIGTIVINLLTQFDIKSAKKFLRDFNKVANLELNKMETKENINE
jgi:hypothetical protein